MSAGGPTLRLAYLYPDLMNLYADRGNVTCLQQRCAWRGIDLRVTTVAWGDELEEPQDIYVIGGGQDRQQRAASEGLTRRHAERIGRDIADGAVPAGRVRRLSADGPVVSRRRRHGVGRARHL